MVIIGTYSHIWHPSGLEYGHSSKTARAHGHVWKFIGRTVGMDGEEMGTGGVYAAQDKSSTNLPLVSDKNIRISLVYG